MRASSVQISCRCDHGTGLSQGVPSAFRLQIQLHIQHPVGMLRQRVAASTARCSDGVHPVVPRSSACRKLPRASRQTSVQPAAASTIQQQSSSANEAPAGKPAGPRHSQPRVQPSSMFYDHHVTRWTPLLALYFPIGIVLALLRSALWIVCIGLDQPWFRDPQVINSYLSLLGVRVVWEGEEHIPSDQPHVLVSNHVSVGDLMMLFTRPQRYIHLITNALPGPVYSASHLPVILRPASKASYEQLAAAYHSNMESSIASYSELESDSDEPGQRQDHRQLQHMNGVVPEVQQVSHGAIAAADGHQAAVGAVTILSAEGLKEVGGHHSSHDLHHTASSSSSNSSNGRSPQVLRHGTAAAAVAASPEAHSSLASADDMAGSSSSSSTALGLHHMIGVPALSNSSSSSSSSSSNRLQQGPPQEEATSVHLFPEGGMTNGRAMMQFSRGFLRFAAPLPVVPVALRLVTPFPTVTCHTWTSGFLANLFWFSFQPWCELRATVLPAQQYQPGSSKAGFVQQVQEAIAAQLGVPISDLNIQQKRKLAQRRK